MKLRRDLTALVLGLCVSGTAFAQTTDTSNLRIKEEGKTVLVSLHDISKAVEIADSFLVLQHGRLVFSGSCEDFLEKCIYKSLFGLERGDFRDCNGKFHIAFF